jgi:DNA-binding transcriptional regulator YdaS (Cro superfamily)
MSEEMAIVQRLFNRAAMRVGSATVLARQLGISYPEVRAYMYGEAMPPEDVLLRVTDVILQDLADIKARSDAEAWHKLFPTPRPGA